MIACTREFPTPMVRVVSMMLQFLSGDALCCASGHLHIIAQCVVALILIQVFRSRFCYAMFSPMMAVCAHL